MALLQGGGREAMKAHAETVQPKWLAGVWPGAEVVPVFLDMFDSLRDENHRNLADCIKAATGAADSPKHVQPASEGHLPVLPQRTCVSEGHWQGPHWLACRSCLASGTGSLCKMHLLLCGKIMFVQGGAARVYLVHSGWSPAAVADTVVAIKAVWSSCHSLGVVTALHQHLGAVAGWPPAGAHYCSAGGVTPRKVFNVGYCGGGAAATVTALWMALQCPTADVRCVTFGSPKVGNAAFTEVFRQASQVTCLAQSAGSLQLLMGASVRRSAMRPSQDLQARSPGHLSHTVCRVP